MVDDVHSFRHNVTDGQTDINGVIISRSACRRAIKKSQVKT